MTESADEAQRPVSVAELLARNGAGEGKIGGHRRRMRGNADAIPVAELTGEIPVIRDRKSGRSRPSPAPAPSTPPAPAPTAERSYLRSTEPALFGGDSMADEAARWGAGRSSSGTDSLRASGSSAAPSSLRSIFPPTPVPEIRPGEPRKSIDFNDATGVIAPIVESVPERVVEPSVQPPAPVAAPKPAPVAEPVNHVVPEPRTAVEPEAEPAVKAPVVQAHVAQADVVEADVADAEAAVAEFAEADVVDAEVAETDVVDADVADAEAEAPALDEGPSVYGAAPDVEHHDDYGHDGDWDEVDHEADHEVDHEHDGVEPLRLASSATPAEAGDVQDARPADGSRAKTYLHGAWIAAQYLLAAAAGAALFVGFRELWGWNQGIALVLGILLIAIFVASLWVVRKTVDLATILIAIVVGALIAFGPLVLMLQASN